MQSGARCRRHRLIMLPANAGSPRLTFSLGDGDYKGDASTGARIRLLDDGGDNGPYRATGPKPVARRSIQSWTVPIVGGSALIFITVLMFTGLSSNLAGGTNDAAAALREQLKPQPPPPPFPPSPPSPPPSPPSSFSSNIIPNGFCADTKI